MLIKRALDIVGAAGGLLVLSPVLLACAIAVRATSEGPAIFSQERYGYNRRRFRMFKFRTMVQDAEVLQAGLEDRTRRRAPCSRSRRTRGSLRSAVSCAAPRSTSSHSSSTC
jgi:lipopolysaccharide/colanic/teichoic acid biosynthesis glycosyltransferase